MYRTFFKRIFDIVFAATALVVLSPFMLLTALCIYLEDRGPVFFRQRRIGRSGEPFDFLKFRSMPVSTTDVPSADADQLSVTKIGKFIRRTNVDELPQLINILKGEMSLVGPRPAIPSQQSLSLMRRDNGASDCPPGLTGLAQVNAYDGMPETEKAQWDGEYASKVTFLNDLRIIFRTLAYLTRKPPVY